MRKNVVFVFILFIAITQMAFVVVYSNGIEGYTNSPGEGNCTSCHVTYPLNSGGGGATIQVLGCTNNYTQQQTYTIAVTIKQTGLHLFGFDFEALDSTGANAGTLALINTGTTVMTNTTVGTKTRTNITHYGGVYATDSCTFLLKWTAPLINTGKVHFYAAANASNGDGYMAGDYIYTSSLQLNPDLNADIIQAKLTEPVVRIYPNPASNVLFIGVNLTEKTCVDVFDINGKPVMRISIKNASFINISSLSEGVYTLLISIDGQTVQKTFVVDR